MEPVVVPMPEPIVETEDDKGEKGECIICFEQLYVLQLAKEDIEQVPADHIAPVCSADHLACGECMTAHIESEMKDGKVIATCPGMDCTYILQPDDISRFVGRGAAAVASIRQFDDNQKKQLADSLTDCPGRLRGQPCPAKFDIPPESVDVAFPYTCKKCDTRFCLGCNTIPPHDVRISCKAFRERDVYELSNVGHPIDMKLKMSLGSKKSGALCFCGVVVERTEGCNHIKHIERSCRQEFCYQCLGPWGALECEHYKCRQPEVNCISCHKRAVRFQVGTPHFVCRGKPAHEFCGDCYGVWDDDHDNLRSCPEQLRIASGISPGSLWN